MQGAQICAYDANMTQSPTYSASAQQRYAARISWNRNDASASMPDSEPKNPELRAACDGSLKTFLLTCFPEAFPLAFSPTHDRMAAEIERGINHGGLKAIAAPRGTGKTSFLNRAGLWAILTGKKRYVCIVAADEASAVSNLQTIKVELNHNEMIHALYPLETWCIRHLGGDNRRARGQHFNGEPTGVDYGRNNINFGTVPGSLTSGAVITTAGITGRIRGQQSTTPDGEIVRPDFLLVDDPQTKLSAASPTQVQKRHETMMGDCLGMAGPGIKISGFCSCTVIYQDDLADRLLNRSISSDWNGDKVSMIESWPNWMEGWDEYNELRIQELTEERPPTESRQFVVDNFERLHDGAKVYWEDRKAKGDVSALQHAMDLYYRDPGVFAAEYQNAPLDTQQNSPYEINIETLCRRTTGLERGEVPDNVDKITAFIDTQRELLYYLVVAWTVEGTAHIIDYGSCPDQKRHHWNKTNVAYPLSEIFGDDFETYLRDGFNWLLDAILGNEYTTSNGAKVMVDRLAIDARWGESTHIIRRIARESKHRARLHPSMGTYIGANSKPWQQLGTKKEQRVQRKGIHAKFITPKEGGRRELFYDTNYWKSFAADRLLCRPGSNKAILLFNDKPHIHRMFAEHCRSEDAVRVIGKTNNEVVEWRQSNSGVVDNDYWDCLVGNCALASTIGVETHQGNKQNNTGLSKAIERVRSKKPDSQFFRKRR